MAQTRKPASSLRKIDLLREGEERKKVASTQVLRKFRQVFNAVKSHFQQVEKKVGVGGAQIWALSVVHNKPGIGMNDLALAMDIHQTTASNLVRSLVKQEMLWLSAKDPISDQSSST